MERKSSWTPEELVKELQKTTIGQKQYLQDLCTTVWMQTMRKDICKSTGELEIQPKLNMLVLGKSGTGKTSSIQALANLLNLCVIVEDASTFTGTGWKGREVSSIIKDVLTLADTPLDAEFAIVVLDEIDKVFANNADNPTFPATNNFLKFIEGEEVQYEENNKVYRMNTENLLFICLGAFDGLDEIITKRLLKGKNTGIGFCTEQSTDIPDNIFSHVKKEDLIEYGINPQFLGRVPLITSTRELTSSDLQQIITDSDSSIIKQLDSLLSSSMGVHASITESAAKYIADKAAMQKTGARALMAELADAFKPGLYQIAGKNDIRELRLDYAPVLGQLSLQYINGCRDVDPVSRRRLPETEYQLDNLKSIPIRLKQYNLASVTQYAEEIVEQADQEGSFDSTNFSYRQVKAATYVLASGILAVVLSDHPHTMYSVHLALEQLFKSPPKLNWMEDDTPQSLYSKALDFNNNSNQFIRLAFTILQDYCFMQIESAEAFSSED